MRVYTVHVRRHGLDPDRDVVLVKEGFCWPAFFFVVLWALWCRLWLVAAGLIAAQVVLNAALIVAGIDALGEAIVQLGFLVLVGSFANDARRWTLKRRGFEEAGVVLARNRDAAEQRFLDHHPELAAGLVR